MMIEMILSFNMLALSGLVITLIVAGAFLLFLLIAAMWLMGLYNGLVKHRNRYKKAFADIDVQLKRRHDLIPNLVETAKEYMVHEKETLEAVMTARNSAMNARSSADSTNRDSVNSLAQAESGLGGALGRLMMVTENYPDLKASQQMSELSEELSHTENKVSFSRQAYNSSVNDYNDKCESFPSNIFANMFNFNTAALFEVSDASERDAVDVKF